MRGNRWGRIALLVVHWSLPALAWPMAYTLATGVCTSDSDCNDGIVCTTDVCDSATGECTSTEIVCGQSERCDPGTGECEAIPCETADDCDDGNLCTSDACVGGSCRHFATDATCDDGDPCTVDDTCQDNSCVGQALLPMGDVDADCDLDLDDYAILAVCLSLSGPNKTPVLSDCVRLFDFDSDSDVDTLDVALFLLAFPGRQCMAGPDADNDGVNDDCDRCPGTPTGTTVDSQGCPDGATCGDGIIDTGEECDDGNFVSGDGCRVDCTIEECGDGIVDPREDCDPPNGETCDDSCNFIAAGSFDADDCADATMLIGEGAFTFDNTNATLDGPGHTECVEFGLDQIELDMWGCWTAPCTATAFAETCGLSDVDTKIAVYAGCDCPVTDANLMACNDDTCDLQSLATFQATAGEQYLIRVGSFPDDPPIGGAGAVSIACGLDACPGDGACTETNDSPGCSDQNCCETVCAVDSFCCDSEWDDVCVQEAEGFCGTGFAACGRGAGSCTEANGTPGCEDADCCNAICRDDSFCCVSDWDDICATAEPATCFSACTAEAGDCSGANDTPGCNDAACCAEVCPRDSFCCDPAGGQWDESCVELAAQHCTD